MRQTVQRSSAVRPQKEEPARGEWAGSVCCSVSRELCVSDGGAALGLTLGTGRDAAHELDEPVDGGRDLAVLLVDNCAAACHGVDVLLHFGSSSTGLQPCGLCARLLSFDGLTMSYKTKSEKRIYCI